MNFNLPDNKKPDFTEKEQYPGKLENYKWRDYFLELSSEKDVLLRVYVLESGLLRFRYAVDGYFVPDFSYAVDPAYRPIYPEVEVSDDGKFVQLQTDRLRLKVNRENFNVSIYDLNGAVILAEEKGFHWEFFEEHGGDIVQMTKRIQKSEMFCGLGDKPVEQNLRGKRFANWGMDEYGFHKNTDPLYKNINFFCAKHHNQSYGIFFDNTFKTHYDFGKERDDVYSFWAEGGEMNYYFFYEESLLAVSTAYTRLTGTAEMPPLWALGYQQCKWSYYPESQVKEVTGKLRELKIPCDAIYLDIDYMDGFRCFTWDIEKFPDPKRMISELAADGFKTMVIIDPGIKIDKNYSVFTEALEKDYFCRTADGPYIKGKVWPGDCYFPDFTKPEVREWWTGLFKGLIEHDGVAGVWNDMNEPALFEMESKTLPLTVRHDFDGHPCSHRKAHNIYGMQMARATHKGVKRYSGDKRVLVITRSGFGGLQRYSSVWTGDNIATWEHLEIAHWQTQRLSICGVSFNGTDIGGFIDQPTPELYARWVQMAVFHPFFRTHSSGDHGDQEPWSFGEEALNIARQYIELRYKLLPLIYTAFYQYHKEAIPMLRPVAFDKNASRFFDNRTDECFFGEHLLFSPIMKEGQTMKTVLLPEGEWYSYWDGEEFKGNRPTEVPAALDSMPIFIRAGAVIAEWPVQQYVDEKEIEGVTLKIFYKDGEEKSHLYIDKYDGYGYQTGDYRYSTFDVKGDDDNLEIHHSWEGEHSPKHKYFELQFIGLPFEVDAVTVDGHEWKSTENDENGHAIFKVPLHFTKIDITAVPGTQEALFRPIIQLINEEYLIPQLDRTRRIAALLPNDYETSGKDYPVLYLHDGQNLFDDDAPYGNWGLKESMTKMARENLQDVIIVAIDHGNKLRLNEYSPFDNERFGKGQGALYLEFLIETLKPHVDKNFRTKHEREFTGIGGSSLGGLISLYAGMKFPDVFGKMLIFSPSLWLSEEIFEMMKKWEPKANTAVYHYSGQKESEEHYPNAVRMKSILGAKGLPNDILDLQFTTHSEGRHHEWFWGVEAPKAIEWLFLRKDK
ncbi:alpha/beta hydrolase-fold protein [Chitinophagales bacterium]|nr:alpha/beta hydrolase-fold protein [Chitinophagales bacterium]